LRTRDLWSATQAQLFFEIGSMLAVKAATAETAPRPRRSKKPSNKSKGKK
jgi:hypothetical protein